MQLSKSLTTAALVLSASAFAADYDLDTSHTTAQFAVKHMMVSTVRGTFEKVTGTATIDDKDITKSKASISIDVNSVQTREPKRDAHLKSPDFFDVEKTPNITFTSTKVEKAGAGLKITGDLTMHGITKPVTFDATMPTAAQKSPWGSSVRAISASTKINRKDWNLNWNKALEAGGLLVSEDVELSFDAELIEKAPGKPTAAAPAAPAKK